MRNLKWIAVLPAALGHLFVFFGLVWMGWVQLLAGTVLVAVGILLWRALGGEWPAPAVHGLRRR